MANASGCCLFIVRNVDWQTKSPEKRSNYILWRRRYPTKAESVFASSPGEGTTGNGLFSPIMWAACPHTAVFQSF